MTDRELLELAALLANVKITWADDGSMCFLEEPWGDLPNCDDPWNPLWDDGDALRLAVKLSLEIIIEMKILAVTAGIVDSWWKEERFKSEAEACAATRRAIVRAAAEMEIIKQGLRNVK